MPLDPTIKAMLDNSAGGLVAADSMPIEELRALVRLYSVREVPLDVELTKVSDRAIAGPGGALQLRIYTPVGHGPHPAAVYFHGGGFVVGDLDTQDVICRGLCAASGFTVVSVDYRLAPENPFPAAVDDACAATLWVHENAASIGVDPDRLVVAGDSAGATISASVALTLRDQGLDIVKAQLLIYGSMAHTPKGATASMIEFENGPIVTAADSTFYWRQYLGSLDMKDPYSQPAYAKNHAGLPPAFVLTAECDPTRDSGESYGRQLSEAGVAVEIKRYVGMPHGFLSWLGVVDAAQQAIDDASAWLRVQF